MLSIYISSLHTMLVEKNLAKMAVADMANFMSIWINLRKNLRFTAEKKKDLEMRRERIKVYLTERAPAHKFDVTR